MKKFFKGLLTVIGILVLLFLLIPALLPAHAHVERSIEIDRSPKEVFTVVSDFHQFEHYDPWGSEDPTNKVTITGEGVGATYEWKGEKAGSGKTTHTVLEAPKLVETEIEMYEPMMDSFSSDYILEPSENGTKVTWSFDQDLTYFSRYFGLMMDGMLGPDFEKGLKNLKEYVEQKAPTDQAESATEPVNDSSVPSSSEPPQENDTGIDQPGE